MAASMIFRCKFDGDNVGFSLTNGSSFNDLCDTIRVTFIEIFSGNFSAKYVFPGAEPCVLCSDQDMGFMFVFYPIVIAEHVELTMKSIEDPNVGFAVVIPDVDPKFNLDIDFDVREQSGGRVFLCEA